MLDLNSIADRRAQALNQEKDGWRQALWSQGFQRLSQNMSDGEVEAFVAYCTTVAHFEKAVQYIEERCLRNHSAPFAVVNEEAKAQGTTPQLWFLKLASA